MKTADFAAHLTEFLSHYLPELKNISTNTISSYCDAFRLFLGYCQDVEGMRIEKLSIDDLTAELVDHFLQWLRIERNNGTATRSQRLAVIRSFVKYLQIKEPRLLLNFQQILAIPVKRAERKAINPLTKEAIALILRQPDTSTLSGRRDATILCFLYDTAARVQEICDLRIEDVRLDYPASVKILGKGRKTRVVPILPATAQNLKKYLTEMHMLAPEKSHLPLFMNRNGQKLTRAGVTYILNKYAKAASVIDPSIPEKIPPHLMRHTSKNTILSYRQTLNIFVAYMRDEIGIGAAELTFSRVDRDVILNFLTWLEKARGCSVSTRNQRLMALRSFLDFAGQIDCTQTSLYLSACNIPSKEAHGRIVEFLTEPALTALLQQPNPSRQKDQRNLVFMILMYDTAARCSELLDMKVCDLRLDAKHPIAYLHGKGRKTRTVPLLNRTVQHCKQYLNKFHPNKDDYSEAPLFYTVIHGRQQKMSPDTVAAFFAKYGSMAKAVCQEVPEHIHPHMMRHTRAMHLYQSGMPMVLLSQYLGHAQVETTMIYAYADTEMKRAAIQKADAVRGTKPVPDEIWADNEEMILKLSGLL